jgi:hypothetical protein
MKGKINFIPVLVCFLCLVIKTQGQTINWVQRNKSSVPQGIAMGKGFCSTFKIRDSINVGNLPTQFGYVDSAGILAPFGTLICFNDSAGNIIRHFNLNVNYIENLCVYNDTAVVFSTSVLKTLYVNQQHTGWVSSYENTGVLVLMLTKSGRVEVLASFPYISGSGLVLTISEQQQKAWALYSNISSLGDTLWQYADSLTLNTSALFEIDIAGKSIHKLYTLPAEVTNICKSAEQDALLFSGGSIQLNHSYTIGNTTYTRNNTSDSATRDVLVGKYNLATQTVDWSKVYKVFFNRQGTFSLPQTAIAENQNKAYLYFRAVDTLTVDGKQYGTLIPFSTQPFFAILQLNTTSGTADWVRMYKGGFVVSFWNNRSSYAGIGLYVSTAQTPFIDSVQVPKAMAGGISFLRLNQQGNIARALNFSFIPNNRNFEPILLTEGDSNIVVSLELLPNDIVKVGDSTYTYRDNLYSGDVLIISFQSTRDDAPTSISPKMYVEHRPVQVYPNPANGMVYLRGFADEQESLVKVVTMQGKVVLEREQPFGLGIDAGSWDKGIYFIHVQTGPNIQVCKLIKE